MGKKARRKERAEQDARRRVGYLRTAAIYERGPDYEVSMAFQTDDPAGLFAAAEEALAAKERMAELEGKGTRLARAFSRLRHFGELRREQVKYLAAETVLAEAVEVRIEGNIELAVHDEWLGNTEPLSVFARYTPTEVATTVLEGGAVDALGKPIPISQMVPAG